jgi:hypothetical protein
MLCSLITNFIPTDVKCGECLCEIMSERKDVKMMMLLYFFVEHWQYVELLYHQFDWNQCAVW